MKTNDKIYILYGQRYDGTRLKSILNEALGNGSLADKAILEWITNIMDYGPDYDLTPYGSKTAWQAYVDSKPNNCSHREFDDPLLDSYSKAVRETIVKGTCEMARAITPLRIDLQVLLYECHN